MGNFGGFTPAWRRLVALPDRRRAFAKGATAGLTEGWPRAEYHVYTHLPVELEPGFAAWLVGFSAAGAGLLVIPDAPASGPHSSPS